MKGHSFIRLYKLFTDIQKSILFYRNFFVAREKASFGAGTGQIWLDDVTCQGNETSLFSCRTNPWGQNNCGHDEDVGVDCDPSMFLSV